MSGLYIHIPFCRKKCNYCDFISYEGKEDKIDPYLNAVVRESGMHSKILNSEKINTIFIGGGTPSILSPRQLRFLFSGIYSGIDSSNVREITVENNPESLDKEKLSGRVLTLPSEVEVDFDKKMIVEYYSR